MPTDEIEEEKEKENLSPEDKVSALKNAILNLGYAIEENEDGEIRISEQT